MDITPVIGIIRLIAKEFSNIADEDVTGWIWFTEPFVGKSVFRHMYTRALAILTAHMMKFLGANIEAGADPVEDIGNIGIGNFMRVGSYSEGKTSISFNHNVSQYALSDAGLLMTEYGIMFKDLRKMRVVSIVNAAEPMGRR